MSGSEDSYAVVQKGRAFRVYHADDARSVGGVIFPPAGGLTGYARARKAADEWTEELRERKSKASSSSSPSTPTSEAKA